MKRTYKSGAQKRKDAASAKHSLEKLPKLTTFFPVATAAREEGTGSSRNLDQPPQPSSQANIVPDNSASTAQNCSSASDIAEKCTAESSDLLPQPSFISLSNDPAKWPNSISDAQRCDIVKRGPNQVKIDFPYNAARRRFSTFHYQRVMNNGEAVPRSWLVYSLETDRVFLFLL